MRIYCEDCRWCDQSYATPLCRNPLAAMSDHTVTRRDAAPPCNYARIHPGKDSKHPCGPDGALFEMRPPRQPEPERKPVGYWRRLRLALAGAEA